MLAVRLSRRSRLRAGRRRVIVYHGLIMHGGQSKGTPRKRQNRGLGDEIASLAFYSGSEIA